jgi:hypothetical protein
LYLIYGKKLPYFNVDDVSDAGVEPEPFVKFGAVMFVAISSLDVDDVIYRFFFNCITLAAEFVNVCFVVSPRLPLISRSFGLLLG